MGSMRVLKHVAARRSPKPMVATLGKGLQRSRCMLQGSPFGAYSAIRIRCCNFLAGRGMPAKSRLDSGLRCKPVIPIGLAPRLLSYGYASAGDRPVFADRDVGVRATQEQFAEFVRFSLVFVPFMQYAG